MIRHACIADTTEFIALVERFRAVLPTYPGCEVDRMEVLHTFGRCVADARCLALVAERDGKLTGALLAMTQQLWFSKAKEATDLLTYAEHPGDGVALLRFFLKWARRQPRVEVITLAQSSGIEIERLRRLYERLGLKTIGSLHQGTVRLEVKSEAA